MDEFDDKYGGPKLQRPRNNHQEATVIKTFPWVERWITSHGSPLDFATIRPTLTKWVTSTYLNQSDAVVTSIK